MLHTRSTAVHTVMDSGVKKSSPELSGPQRIENLLHIFEVTVASPLVKVRINVPHSICIAETFRWSLNVKLLLNRRTSLTNTKSQIMLGKAEIRARKLRDRRVMTEWRTADLSKQLGADWRRTDILSGENVGFCRSVYEAQADSKTGCVIGK